MRVITDRLKKIGSRRATDIIASNWKLMSVVYIQSGRINNKAIVRDNYAKY